MAIYELVEWNVMPGKMEEILKLEEPYQAWIRSNGGKPIGGFTTAVGDTSRLLAIVAYDDASQFGQGLQTAQQNPELQKLVQAAAGLFTDLKTSLLMPTPASSLK